MKLYRRREVDQWLVEVDAEPVPWCAEHDQQSLGGILGAACQRGIDERDWGNCCLEDPPKHFYIKEGP